MIAANISNYDIIFGAIIVISTALALFRGAIAEVLSLATWIGSFWLMHKFGETIARHLPSVMTNNPLLRNVAVFIIIFIAIAIAAKLIKMLLEACVKGLGLGGLDYLLGIIFGFCRGVIICAVMIILVAMLHLDREQTYKKSLGYPYLQPYINLIAQAIPRSL